MNARAVFLDRDGVLVPDDGGIADGHQPELLDGVPEALGRLAGRGFELVVVSNQTVVARGLASLADVERANDSIRALVAAEGGPALEHFYICPHHPKATLEAYRCDCDCRKPKAGLLQRAARDLALDLPASFMVGDRITDILAGRAAGCRTILVTTGRHLDPPIETTVPVDLSVRPDQTCATLGAAADWILGQ